MLALVILFILLSPGFLLSIPPVAGRYFHTGKTCTTAVLIHAIIFGVVLYLLRNYYPQVLAEGFASTTSAQPLAGLSLGGGAALTRNGLGARARAAAKANLGNLQGAVGTTAAAKLRMAK